METFRLWSKEREKNPAKVFFSPLYAAVKSPTAATLLQNWVIVAFKIFHYKRVNLFNNTYAPPPPSSRLRPIILFWTSPDRTFNRKTQPIKLPRVHPYYAYNTCTHNVNLPPHVLVNILTFRINYTRYYYNCMYNIENCLCPPPAIVRGRLNNDVMIIAVLYMLK